MITTHIESIIDQIRAWYVDHARDLPWRRADATAWGILISEVMLQQTPVIRVLGPWQEWVERWPTPAALADEDSGTAVIAWGRLGYPRRALRLHTTATMIVEKFGGTVPNLESDLRTLAGIGEYTAAAVAAFAYGQPTLVLDTNIRRVLSRLDQAEALPPSHLTKQERAQALRYTEAAKDLAPSWSVSIMELGALVCTATNPACHRCPVQDHCAWLKAGKPQADADRKRSQAWHGTDRQCRGLIIERLRTANQPLPRADLIQLWPDPARATQLLNDLVREGLVRTTGEFYSLLASPIGP